MLIVPYMNTPAGAALTRTDWEAANVTQAVLDARYLDWTIARQQPLLQKGVHAFFEWQGVLGVDMTTVSLSRKGRATFISPMDGSKTCLDPEVFLERLSAFKADFMLFSPSQWHCIEPLFNARFEHLNAMLCAKPDEAGSHIKDARPVAIKISEREEACQLKDDHGACMVLSDAPALDACSGIVYSKASTYRISDACYTNDTALLCDACQCVACQNGLTRAYFHHLQAEVPFLSRRFLMVHNLMHRIS